MNWKLIFLLSLFGLAMGLGTVSLIPSTIEPICWLVVFLVSAFFVAKNAPGKYFLHGFFVSLVNCVWVTGAHAIFFYQYVAAHPEYMQAVNGSGLPETLLGHPRRLM